MMTEATPGMHPARHPARLTVAAQAVLEGSLVGIARASGA
jgi:hypothetical protein